MKRTIRSVVLGLTMIAASTAVAPARAAETPKPTFPIGGLRYTVKVAEPGHDNERVFYTASLPAVLPKELSAILSALPPFRPANVIADKSGREIWRYSPPIGQNVADFRKQTYHGKPVLTWWQGVEKGGYGSGVGYIADENYHVIKTVTPGDGLTADEHEFRLTSDGRALIASYDEVTADLTSIGGPADGKVLDAVASIVDVDSGRTLFRWRALDHVPLTETQMPGLVSGQTAYDPYHINSMSLAPNGDLIVSLRNTSTVYSIDTDTGELNWKLGGKNSTLALGPGVEFAFQHDAQAVDANTIRLFNNNSSNMNSAQGYSSVEWIHVDPATRKATLVRNQVHPDGMTAFAMGNAQALPHGDTAVSWGTAPRISKFSARGDLLYDASLPFGTYRAYLADWPDDSP